MSSLLRHSRKLRSLQSALACERSTLVQNFPTRPSFFILKENGVGKGTFSVGLNKGYIWARASNSCITNAVRGLNSSVSCGQIASARPFSSGAVPDLQPDQEIRMPLLSPTMTEGNIAKCLKKEGDKISPHEDKATVKIVNGDGAKEIKVDEMIAITVQEEGDIEKLEYKLPYSAEPVTRAESEARPEPSQPKVEEKVLCFFPLLRSSRLFSAEAGSKEVPTHVIKPWEYEICDDDDDEELGSKQVITPIIKPWKNHFSDDNNEIVGIRGPIGPDGLPTYVDWRAAGAVTPVQNQRNCGSCWAMSAVAPIEALNFITTGKLVKLSAQQLLDCNDAQICGSVTGTVRGAYDYIIRTGGIVEEKYYRYTARCGVCRRMTAPGVTIDDYQVIEYGSEWDLKCAVARQPVAVWVYIDQSFVNYTEGILDGCSYLSGNHYLTVVAYDSRDGQDYWEAKNSWDTTWGEDGYIRIARGVNRVFGPFGITRLIIYPLKWSRNGLCSVKSDMDMGTRPFRRTRSRTW